jgi:hypothetical protein
MAVTMKNVVFWNLHCVALVRRFLQKPDGVTSQKTPFFWYGIVNPTQTAFNVGPAGQIRHALKHAILSANI